MRILQILQPVKIKVFAPTAQDKQDKLVVPYSLQAGLVNSGQLPAVNCVLCWQWAGERGLEVQISWALPRDDCPTGSRADNEKPGREDWKWGQCRFTSESWCNAGSSRVLVWCVCDRMSQRMEGWRYRSLRLEVVVSACRSSWDMSLCWLSREEAAGEALVWTLGLQGIWTQAGSTMELLSLALFLTLDLSWQVCFPLVRCFHFRLALQHRESWHAPVCRARVSYFPERSGKFRATCILLYLPAKIKLLGKERHKPGGRMIQKQ